MDDYKIIMLTISNLYKSSFIQLAKKLNDCIERKTNEVSLHVLLYNYSENVLKN